MSKMSFVDALKHLGIEDYADRIFSSNSHGELFHLQQYIDIASVLNDKEAEAFKDWFVGLVEWANENWDRPASIYQHVLKIFIQ